MKFIKVDSPSGDFGALAFESEFKGKPVRELIEGMDSNIVTLILNEDRHDEVDIEIELIEMEVSMEFFTWVKRILMDYNSSKHKNIYSEFEIIDR